MEQLRYFVNWHDFLTKCRYRKGVYVGSYACRQCDHFHGDYKFTVNCSFREDERRNHRPWMDFDVFDRDDMYVGTILLKPDASGTVSQEALDLAVNQRYPSLRGRFSVEPVKK